MAAVAIGAVGASSLVACQHIVKEITVNSTADAVDANPGDGTCATAGGVCTLRAAVQEANATTLDPSKFDAVEIHLAPSALYDLTLNGVDQNAAAGDLDLNASVLIDGQGARVDGPLHDRAFDIGSAGTTPSVVIQNLTINGQTGADGSDGGGIRLVGGSLDLESSTIVNPVAMHEGGAIFQSPGAGALTVNLSTFVGGSAGAGAAITTNGPATITSTTFIVNVSTSVGGAIHQQSGSLTLDGDTLTQNHADSTTAGRGGAVATEAGTTLTVRRSTFDHNAAGQGSSIWSLGSTTVRASTFVDGTDSGPFILGLAGGTMSLGGSAIDIDTGSGEPASDVCSGPITSVGYNELRDASCGTLATGDRIGSPSLGGLTTNGGPTLTRLPRSDLVDAIPSGTAGLCDATTTLDQRGKPRPSGPACDIGAVERQPSDPA